MKYFIDTEFIERGPGKPIDLISIGVVTEDEREFYAISADFSPKHASDWVKAHVLVHLPDRKLFDAYEPPSLRTESTYWIKRDDIAQKLLAFIGDDPSPEFWGWCCDFDYVVISQMIGFNNWPTGWPFYFRDIQQVADHWGLLLSDIAESQRHNAINDARWIRELHGRLMTSPLKHFTQICPSCDAINHQIEAVTR